MAKKALYSSPEMELVEIDYYDILGISDGISSQDPLTDTSGSYDWNDDFIH